MRSGPARPTSCRGSARGIGCSSGTPPTFRWFVGGRDQSRLQRRRSPRARRATAATPRSSTSTSAASASVQTYAQLLHEVKRIAAALRGLGIGKGDRITIYMPPCPESIALMLATVRIGAIHSVVFAGFGAQALADRIEASGSRVVFTADVTYRKGKDVPLQGDRRRRACRSCGGDRWSAWSSSSDGRRAVRRDRDIVVGRLPARGAGQDREPRGRWRRTSRRSSSRPPARPPSRSWRSTRTAATRSTCQHGPVVLRPEADRRVVGDVGHRLDRRPQLHGLRAAAHRLHDGRLRGRARLSRTPTPTGARRSRSSASPASSRRRPRCAC